MSSASFPLKGSNGVARLSCVAVSEPVTPCCEPFCASHERLAELLSKILPRGPVEAILADLGGDLEVQLTIDDEAARSLGFLAKVM